MNTYLIIFNPNEDDKRVHSVTREADFLDKAVEWFAKEYKWAIIIMVTQIN